MKKSELRQIIREEIRKITEDKVDPKIKKEFQRWAKEIYDNLLKDFPKLKDETLNKLSYVIIGVIMDMANSTSNSKYKKYFPKKFDRTLVSNGDKNTYDSPWFRQSDNQQFTIIKKALMSK